MKTQLIQLSLFFWMLSFGTSGYSQLKKEKQAIQRFDRMAYVDAIQLYEQIAAKGYINPLVLQNLADAYYFNSRFEEANKWYTLLFEGEYNNKNTTKLPSEYYYRYAQTLKSMGDYQKSQRLMLQFTTLEQEDSRSLLYQKNRDYLTVIEQQSGQYDIQSLDINSAYSDYGGTLLGNNFVFTSARATAFQKEKNLDKRTRETFTSLYRSTLDTLGFSAAVLFAPEINAQIHDATPVFTQDGNTMYFTRNNSKANGQSKQNKSQTAVLKLYKAIKQPDGSWGQVTALPFNSDYFNTGHPALTPDNKWLYFVSDRKGTHGQADLFRVGCYENETYGPVENLGPTINTAGKESFPFISTDYYLYFSSDGHPGLGGLDVFRTKIYPDGHFGPVINMSTPINSERDDFAFYFDPKENKGFISSNRKGGKGSDDIYFFSKKPNKQYIEGKIYDKETKEALVDASVIIYDARYQKTDTLYTNCHGHYRSTPLDHDYKYRIKVEKAYYNTVEIALNVNKEPGIKIVNIGLAPTKRALQLNDDLAQRLQLEPIYFDFDESYIRYDATVELMKIVAIMKEYPTMKIDVRSHTDSQGEDTYNLMLSDRRAKATIKWIVKQGIDPARLTGRGYGETQLKNKCANGVPCNDMEHQSNRRSDFIIQTL
ncbi:OmpA family protein [Myroides sp. 1354]|uniref:OmpA family protein n=1 Tax=unclassified Myroides TaxID=2642485 RepID=UPI00257802F7|nr:MULTISPECIES: OmpA family protein [unclassified Myroides]MDM1044696.1 OmpA family protein [Myroides sp. R163-1]MDM1055409.1 OmpA family protein [Myroides sp. 1354]MDM1068706.1 OmpA family protein [Myroides sp. 1372]